MSSKRSIIVSFVLVAFVFTACSIAVEPLDQYNVVWNSPSGDQNGSMPLGNGNVALNAWVEKGGDLLFYISSTDAWSQSGELLKLGRIRVSLSNNQLEQPDSFRQILKLSEGTIWILTDQVHIALWVDANNSSIHIDAKSKTPVSLDVMIENWRDEDKIITSGDEVIWYHRNEASNFAQRLKAHNLGGLEKTYPDPLINRTFGGCITGDNMHPGKAAGKLVSERPAGEFHVTIPLLIEQTTTAQQWLKRLKKNTNAIKSISNDKARRDHIKWWSQFWNRSWIRITSNNEISDVDSSGITATNSPLTIGADENGQNRFKGHIAQVQIYRRALTAAQVLQKSKSMGMPLFSDKSLAAMWRFDEFKDGGFPNKWLGDFNAAGRGKIEVVEYKGIKAARFDGNSWLEVKHDPH